MEMEKTKHAVTTLWPKLVYIKVGAVVEGPGLYEKWCSDSQNSDEKPSICTSQSKKKKM